MCWEGGGGLIQFGRSSLWYVKERKQMYLPYLFATAVSWLMKIPKDSPFGEAVVTVFLKNIHIYFFLL